MVARLGRPIPVDVIIPNITPPSPLVASSSPSAYHVTTPPRHVRFGRVALKACLGAVCMASPELLPDGKRDYIIYAVDPEESLRANQLRSPSASSPSRSASSTSLRDRAEPGSTKLPASPPRAKDAPTSILVGKGFFNWALEEYGDGETTVTGRVRSDGRRLRYDNGREYEEDINVLEVVIKLKESQARNKDKYFNLVRGLSSASTSSFSAASDSRAPSSSRTSDIEPPSPTHRFRSRHSHRDQHLTLHSEPDYPTSADSPIDTHPRRSLARSVHRHAPSAADAQPQRDLSPKTTTQQLGPAPGLPLHPTLAASSSASAQQPQSATSPSAVSSAAAANPSTLQLLTILHSLQQRSSKSAPEPAQQAQLENLLQQVAQVFGTASPASPSEAPLSSPALRPLEPIPVPNARSPAPHPASDASTATAPAPATVQSGKENRRVSLPAQAATKDSPQVGFSEHNSRRSSASSPALDHDDAAPSPSIQRKDHESTNRICYNCGTNVPTTWRILKLPAGSIINNPAAEKPAATSTDASADDADSGWKPRFDATQSPVHADGESRWSACNPCGLYYLKWNNSRPEYVWKKEHATKAYRERKALADAAKRRRDTVEAGSSKRARIANSDVDAASPYSAAATPHGSNKPNGDAEARDESTSPNYDASTPASSSGRKASMPRTLSEACHRDAEKLESQRTTKKKEKEKPLCKKQADREYVLDHNTGKWRSRRSMRENPEGKRPGRPKGSVKVPQNATKPGGDDSSPPTTTKDEALMQPLSASAKQADAGSSSSDASGSKPSGSANKAQSNLAAGQREVDFRLPAPPQPMAPQLARQASASRMVNFAQSSPVRPSMNASLMQPEAVNALHRFGAHMLESPSRDVRFRVPSYLMNSSPGTMLDTLMSEADFDFEELGPLGPLQTPGTLLGNMRDAGTPLRLRRSPRKNPHGTISGQNPYASPTAKRGSPSFGRERRAQVPESPSRRSVVASSSASPVTRSRTRSGQGVLHPALYSSSDGAENAHAKSSSNVTSPASPSEAAGKAAGKGKGKAASSLQATGKTQLASKQAQVEASARAASRRRRADADDQDDDAPETQFVKGPYRSASREGSAGLPSCPASPSLGRANRKLGRHLSSVSAHSPQSGAATLARLDLPPSSPAFDPPTGRSSGSIEVDGWGRTPSMREIFPTPSDLDWPSDASPAPQGDAATAPSVQPESDKQLVVKPSTAVVRRRPLPATVEDGSSSVSGSSPAHSDDSPEGSTNMFDLLEDPYGILAASGFGIDADGALTSLEIPVPAQQQMTPTSSAAASGPAPSISADKFNDVSLHPAQEFGAHLSEFNSSGGVGVAAHVAGTGTAAAVQIANPSDASVNSLAGVDAGFLATLPRELSAILTSPKKNIPPKIIELLASPSKAKPFADPPSPGLERVQGETHDFSALFANPDIQALLAEFESMP